MTCIKMSSDRQVGFGRTDMQGQTACYIRSDLNPT